MNNAHRSGLFAAALLLGADIACAAQRPTVVELFTSQGCSSCPPADIYLTELARNAGVLALAFHVDYWDSLGWKDPYALAAATERQERYAAHLRKGPYTPQMVVDGGSVIVGSDRRGVAAAIERARSEAANVEVTLASGGATLTIEVGSGTGAAQILLVGFDRQHETAVMHGENAGKTLLESSIVRSLTGIGRWSGEPLKLSIAAPAGEGVAVLLQSDDGRIVGAATTK